MPSVIPSFFHYHTTSNTTSFCHVIEVCAENPNCFIEISNINACVINDAKNKGVLGQVLFGTDTPFNYFNVMKSCVECALTDDAEKELVYHKNFERILSQIQIR